MATDPAEISYEQFLDAWGPTRHLQHATLSSNLFDPLAQARLLADSEGVAEVPRYLRSAGSYNGMTPYEQALRHLSFFTSRQPSWAAEFRERLVEEGVRARCVEIFVAALAGLWVDGANRRQGAPEMLALKTSIGMHDRMYFAAHAGKYVINAFDEKVAPLFEPSEMKTVFEVNSRMLENHMASYINEIYGDRSGSINFLFVRRGVCMPHKPRPLLEELHYLASYSLASGSAELFAQTQGRTSCSAGVPCIFSAPLPAIQHRIVAFAPFIQGMKLDQMEFVVAPPVRPTSVSSLGEFGEGAARIAEYQFD